MRSRRKLTVISSLGGLLFGYDTGIISGNQLYMRDDLGLAQRNRQCKPRPVPRGLPALQHCRIAAK